MGGVVENCQLGVEYRAGTSGTWAGHVGLGCRSEESQKCESCLQPCTDSRCKTCVCKLVYVDQFWAGGQEISTHSLRHLHPLSSVESSEYSAPRPISDHTSTPILQPNVPSFTIDD